MIVMEPNTYGRVPGKIESCVEGSGGEWGGGMGGDGHNRHPASTKVILKTKASLHL